MKRIYISFALLSLVVFLFQSCNKNEINRYKVVKRHNVYLRKFDSLSSLTVGNGKFAFTVDATGLQSFPEYYEKGVCLGTMSDWAWHSFPDTENFSIDETKKFCKCNDKFVPYSVQWKQPIRNVEATEYFRKNPHRIHLGIIGFDFYENSGKKIDTSKIKNINQKLDLWKGMIISNYKINNKKIKVLTCAHPNYDAIACKISTPLIKYKQIFIKIRLPYPTGNHTDSGCDWSKDSLHQSSIVKLSSNFAILKHKLDDFEYYIKITWEGNGKLMKKSNHFYYLIPEKSKNFKFTVHFAINLSELSNNLVFAEILRSSKESWKKFWTTGGFIDLSGSKDKRAFELERRIILSRYLTKVQCTGLYPPQETGLTFNSWYGKFHLEMIWWHCVHFILWNQPEYVERILDYYFKIEKKAEELAREQGYNGVRWPKMTSPEGVNSPSSVGSFLIWQQPHFIYIVELLYRHYKNENIIKKYEKLVYKTAEFMASYTWFDKKNKRYVLGPCLIPAQECYPSDSTINPAFELTYWKWGLKTANIWRERSGYKRISKWDSICDNLSKLIIKDSLYIFAESTPESYTKRFTHDHPIILGIFGMLPGEVDTNIMSNTLKKVINIWQWDKTWGWDYPLSAMCAVRLGFPELAIDLLLMNTQKNTYLINGHNYQDNRLRIYLPGNGGLLTTIAMMCAGFDGNKKILPGFPEHNWKVKWENLSPLP